LHFISKISNTNHNKCGIIDLKEELKRKTIAPNIQKLFLPYAGVLFIILYSIGVL
jgi:hypothetical protein